MSAPDELSSSSVPRTPGRPLTAAEERLEAQARFHEALAAQSVTFSAVVEKQTAAFDRIIKDLRWEVRLLLIIAAVLVLARDGVMTRFIIPGLVVETHAADVPLAAAPLGVP